MKNTNKRGDIQMSPKYLPPDVYEYLIQIAKKQNLTQTAIVIRALRHDQKNNEQAKFK